ncbi:MAG TPA: hypothetical protein VF401_02530 [Candidatus Saccharimonadales bacterium]
MFQYLGLILVPISWVAGVYLVRKWRGTYAMSISKHAASAKDASKLFAVILGGGSALFYWWLIEWFTPHLKLGSVFVILLSFTAAAQIVVALIPDTIGWRHHVHQKVALAMAACYVPLTYLILASGNVSTAARVIAYACVASTLIAGLLFLCVKKARNYYLIFQSMYIVAFQVIILSVAYVH